MKLIKTNQDYHQAIDLMETIGDDPNFDQDKSLKEDFELLSVLIDRYEKERFPIGAGNISEIIKLKMEYSGIKTQRIDKM